MKELYFEQEDGKWRCEYISEGSSVLQIERKSSGALSINAALTEDITPCPIRVYPAAYGVDNIMTNINVPVGSRVIIESETEVVKAVLADNVQPDIDVFACSDDAACLDVNNEQLFVREF